jgi:hypothetical protein
MPIDGTVEATTFTSTDRLKLAIIGAPKAGKSRLAVTCEKPALLWDFDDRSESVAGTAGLFIKKSVDTTPTNPTAVSTLIADIGKLEYDKKQGKLEYKTFILDSMTYLAKAAVNYSMKENVAGRKELLLGGNMFFIARGYEPYAGEDQIISNCLVRLFQLGSVIAVFHERPEEAPESTQENPKYTGKLLVEPPRYKNYLPLFNEQWRMKALANGTYQVQTKPDGQFTAATCMTIDATEKPDILEMIKKHKSKGGK